MTDETEVEVPGTPDETEDPATEPVVPEPPLDPSVTPSTEPSAPADVPTPTDTPVTDPAAPEVATPNPTPATDVPASTNDTSGIPATVEVAAPTPPVAGVVEVPPEPVAPPPPPPVADSVATIDAADDQARADQAEREAKAFALSTNGVVPPPIVPPPPLAGIADAPTVDRTPITGNTLWICVTEEGPRTTIGGVGCPIFMVERIPPQGQLLTCPTCGSTSVRQATEAEQQLPQTVEV